LASEAKAKDKDLTFKAKAKAKDLTFEAEAKYLTFYVKSMIPEAYAELDMSPFLLTLSNPIQK